MRSTHSPDSVSAPADRGAPSDEVPVQLANDCKGARTQGRKVEVIDCRLDYQQVQERWHRDPWGRQDTQSVTKAVENQTNLEEALYHEGFSQARAVKIASYMTRCEGQFQEWDLIVKEKLRVNERLPQEGKVVESTSSSTRDLFDDVLDEDGVEEDTAEGGSDEERCDTRSLAEGERQRLPELKSAVNVKVSSTKSGGHLSQLDERRRRRKERKDKALRSKEYASYTYDDYVQAARRFDIVYGSADRLYELAQEKKDSLRHRLQQMKNPPTTEMIIQGKPVEVEDPTFGITLPSADQALSPAERRSRDHHDKEVRAEMQRDTLIRSLEKQEIMQSMGKGMFQ